MARKSQAQQLALSNIERLERMVRLCIGDLSVLEARREVYLDELKEARKVYEELTTRKLGNSGESDEIT